MIRFSGLAVVLGFLLGSGCGLAQPAEPPEPLPALLEKIEKLERSGEYQHVRDLARKAVDRASAEDPSGSTFLKALEALGRAELQLQSYPEAETALRQASELREKRLEQATGPSGDDDVTNLGNDLQFLALAVAHRDRVDEAIRLLWRAVDLFENRLGDGMELQPLNTLRMLLVVNERPEIMTRVEEKLRLAWGRLNALIGSEYPGEGLDPELMSRALDDEEEFGLRLFESLRAIEGPEDLAPLAELLAAYEHEDEGRFEEAEAVVRRHLSGKMLSTPAGRLLAGHIHGQLAGLVFLRNEFQGARDHYQASLEILEGELGPSHLQVSYALDGIGRSEMRLGHYEAAEPFFRRSFEMRRRLLGDEHTFVAHALGRLGWVGAALRRPVTVQGPLVQQAEKIYAAAFRHEPKRVAGISIMELDMIFERTLRQAAVLEPLGEQLALLPSAGTAPDSPKRASELEANPVFLQVAGRHTEVEQRLRKALEIRRAFGVDDDLAIASDLYQLSLSYSLRGRAAEGLEAIGEASAIHRRRLTRLGYRRDEEIWRQQKVARQVFLTHHRALVERLESEPADSAHRGKLLEQAFEEAQLALGSRSAIAVARTSSRESRDGRLASLIRRHQDLVAAREVADLRLTSLMAGGEAEDRAERNRLRQQLEASDRELDQLAAEIALADPDYADLAFPRPSTLAEVRGALRPGEALVVFAGERDTSYMVPHKSTWVWWIDREGARVHRSGLAEAELGELVSTLRQELRPSSGRGFTIGADDKASFGFAPADRLYRELFSPFAAELGRTRHLFVVMDGPLESLPLGVFLEQPLKDGQELREAAWLGRRISISLLPGVSSLDRLRRRAPVPLTRSAFLGFGDPLLGGDSAAGLATVEATSSSGGLAGVEQLRRLQRLPETELELEMVAGQLKSTRTEIYLRERATESRIRAMDLEPFGVIAFATHGLTAGEFPGLAEPALVLTPPPAALAADDGLLTASEIALLRLRAEWVILSACNTASSDGVPGAEGLSGLARAFLYAGARRLLVSHWKVLTDAAVAIDTGMFGYLEADPAMGPAEALRRAMVDQIDKGGDQAHPRFWAPFVLVGDGG